MENIKTYLLTITAAAIICAIVRSLTAGKGSVSKLMQVIAGLFMSVTLISPLIQLDFSEIPDYFTGISESAEVLSEDGTAYANNAMNAIIKQRLESYILDEAKRLGTDMDVEVKITESNPPVPYQVVMCGSISPFHKRSLMAYISENLGIPQESQIWI